MEKEAALKKMAPKADVDMDDMRFKERTEKKQKMR